VSSGVAAPVGDFRYQRPAATRIGGTGGPQQPLSDPDVGTESLPPLLGGYRRGPASAAPAVGASQTASDRPAGKSRQPAARRLGQTGPGLYRFALRPRRSRQLPRRLPQSNRSVRRQRAGDAAATIAA